MSTFEFPPSPIFGSSLPTGENKGMQDDTLVARDDEQFSLGYVPSEVAPFMDSRAAGAAIIDLDDLTSAVHGFHSVHGIEDLTVEDLAAALRRLQ